MLVTKQLTVAIVLVWKNNMEVNGYRQLLCYQHSSKHLLLCLTQERNSYRFWEWQNDHFWLNYPFKKDLKDTSKHFTDIQSHHHICSDLSGAYPYLCTLQSTILPSKKTWSTARFYSSHSFNKTSTTCVRNISKYDQELVLQLCNYNFIRTLFHCTS